MSDQEQPEFMKGLDFTEEDSPDIAGTLEKVAKLAEKQEQAEDRVRYLEAELSKAEAFLADISEKQIPELMASLGLDEVKTKDGLKVKIKSTLRASIPQEDLDKQKAAFEWLEAHGHDHLIKREIKVMFGKADTKWANKFEADLRKRKRPLVWDRKMTVHPKTLSAFISNELEKGTDIPMETFHAYSQKYSKIERAK